MNPTNVSRTTLIVSAILVVILSFGAGILGSLVLPSAGPAGPPGKTGPAGAAGPAGPTGAAAIFRSGVGAPSASSGNDGDAYVDTSNGNFYIKANGSWSQQGNLRGPAGAAGATGPAGPAGPAGAKGDTGATGATGPAGPEGPAGPPGPPGPPGEQGPQGEPGPAG